jgi:hypothetical protein
MYSTALRSSSSLHAMQPPIGGMTFNPFLTDPNRASLPFAIRDAQAWLSPNFGAFATPVAWQFLHAF